MSTEAEFVRNLLVVNSAACARYLAIASRSRNSVLRYVLGDIARQKRSAHQSLELGAYENTALPVVPVDWPAKVMRIYRCCEKEFDDDATDRLAARLLTAEQMLLQAVEDAYAAASPGELERQLGAAMPRFRAISSELNALSRYNQHLAGNGITLAG